MIETNLGSLCKEQGRYGIGAPAIDFNSNLPTYLRITDIRDDGTLDLKSLKSVADPKASEYLLKKNDIVFARTGNSTGRNYFYDPRDGNFAFAGFLIKFSIDENLVNPQYIKYFTQSAFYWNWIESIKTGSTRGNINAKTYAEMPIILPSRESQDKIVFILNSISEKIRINNQINDYLIYCSRSLFSHWFIDYGKWGGTKPLEWKEDSLGEHVVVKRGGSPRPIQEFLSDKGFRWLKISDVTGVLSPYILSIKEHIKESGLNKTVHLNPGDLVLSNSATPGIPKILDLDTCIHDGWLYFPESELSNEWLYLYFLYQREQLVSLANGSVFKNLKTDIVKNFKLTIPSRTALNEFQEIIDPLFNQMLSCSRESARLELLRDTLLSKLMSGEIDISKVDVTQLNNHLCDC